jgi:hypothetical protein
MEWGVFSLKDGTAVLLPMWVYTGVDVASEAVSGGYEVRFGVIAIDPAYLDIASLATKPNGIG